MLLVAVAEWQYIWATVAPLIYCACFVRTAVRLLSTNTSFTLTFEAGICDLIVLAPDQCLSVSFLSYFMWFYAFIESLFACSPCDFDNGTQTDNPVTSFIRLWKYGYVNLLSFRLSMYIKFSYFVDASYELSFCAWNCSIRRLIIMRSLIRISWILKSGVVINSFLNFMSGI